MAKSKQTEQEVQHEERAPEIDNVVIYVRAKKVGVYDSGDGRGALRFYPADFDHPRAGEIFVLRSRTGMSKSKKYKERATEVTISAEEQFSDNWMERVSIEEAQQDAGLRRRLGPKKAVITKTAAERSII